MKIYKLISSIALAITIGFTSMGQDNSVQDTVIVNFGKTSKIVFYVNDKNDLASLEHYDLNAIANDLRVKLQEKDSVSAKEIIETESSDKFLKENTESTDNLVPNKTIVEKNKRDSVDTRTLVKKYGTSHSINFDLGLNNYLQNGKFPNDNNEPYSLSPWGSWYFSIGSVYKSQLSGKLFLEYGANVSWHNFKFENDKIRIQKNANGVTFVEDPTVTDFVKSKLGTTHLNISLVPVIDFGKKQIVRKKVWERWDNDGDRYKNGFRIGLGGYAGYKLASHAKYVIEEDNDKKKNKDKDSFYLNNWRYGARLRIGFRGTDIFFNYDMNELFSEDKGPSLNAFSFGITL